MLLLLLLLLRAVRRYFAYLSSTSQLLCVGAAHLLATCVGCNSARLGILGEAVEETTVLERVVQGNVAEVAQVCCTAQHSTAVQYTRDDWRMVTVTHDST